MWYIATSTFTLLTLNVLFAPSFVRSLPGIKVLRNTRPSYIECDNSNECAFDSCCVLGMGRYSIPKCQKKQQLHEICRPASDEAVNTTVYYPDKSVVPLHNVHMILCPCAEGLVCGRATGNCAEFDSTSSYNHVHEKESVDD